MVENLEELVQNLRETDPEDIYQLFRKERKGINRDFLKDLYDVLLQERQREWLERDDFVR